MNLLLLKSFIFFCLASTVTGRPSLEDSRTGTRQVRSALRGISFSNFHLKMPHEYKSICGISGARSVRSLEPLYKVLNGTCTPYGMYPWTVQIQMREEDSFRQHCGGTIITEDVILTAAHCMQDKNTDDIRIVVGQGSLEVTEDYEMVFEIHSVEIHPEYDRPRGSFTNDVALIRILRKGDGNGISFSSAVGPACLPREDLPHKPGMQCTVSGWGKTEEETEDDQETCLRSATVPIIDEEKCRYWYKQSHSPLSNGMMCAGYENGGVDACTGDSGGPLACSDEGRFYIVGIVSWGRGCGERRKPGIYTRVKNYIDWIEHTLKAMDNF